MDNPKKPKDYYQDLDFRLLITPDDLLKPFEQLVEKTNDLERIEAPKMLVTVMRSLALEIEISHRQALAIINPENPEPIRITIFAVNSEAGIERVKIIRILKRAGWAVKHLEGLTNCVELTVQKFESVSV